MWVNIHNEWESIEKINAKTLLVTLILLFFCSMIPYATDLVSGDFNNKLAQGFYGVFVICVTLANIGLSMVLQNENKESKKPVEVMRKRRLLLWIDVGIKVIVSDLCKKSGSKDILSKYYLGITDNYR